MTSSLRHRLWQAGNHVFLIAGLVFMVLPIVVIFVSSTHETSLLVKQGLQLWPGSQASENYSQVLRFQAGFTDQITALDMLKNSLIIALGVASLTTLVSLMGAYGLVYFKLPLCGLSILGDTCNAFATT